MELVSSKNADIVFTSVYESLTDIWRRRLLTRQTNPGLPTLRKQPNSSARHVWVSGENYRVPFEAYDLSISFDVDTYAGSNLYWPYIFENIDWGFNTRHLTAPPLNTRGIPLLEPQQLSSHRDHLVSDRSGFVCAFIGNPEPVRMRAIEALRQYGEVDVFGKAVGKPVEAKAPIAARYRFVLSFENDLYPGYVTEKALESYVCGAIPLWRGLDPVGILNTEAVVNAHDFDSIEHFAAHVGALQNQPCELDWIVQQPLFRTTPSLTPLVNSLRAIL